MRDTRKTSSDLSTAIMQTFHKKKNKSKKKQDLEQSDPKKEKPKKVSLPKLAESEVAEQGEQSKKNTAKTAVLNRNERKYETNEQKPTQKLERSNESSLIEPKMTRRLSVQRSMENLKQLREKVQNHFLIKDSERKK